MTLTRKIALHTVYQSVGKVVSVAFGLVTIGALSRYLQVSGYGAYSTIIAYMGFVGVLADLGLYIIVVREISLPDANEEKILSNAFTLRLVSAIAILVLGAVIGLVFPYSTEIKLGLFIGILAFLASTMNQVMTGVFQKHIRTGMFTLAEVGGRLVFLVVVFELIASNVGLLWFVGALALSNIVQFVLTFIFSRRFSRVGLAFDFSYWKYLLRETAPQTASVILNLLYFKADTIILSVFHSADAVGIYSLPYKVLEVLLAFPAMFVGLIIPILSQTAFNDWPRFRRVFQLAFDSLVIAIAPVVVVTLFFAPEIIRLIAGPGFDDSALVLRMLIFAVIAIYLGTLFGYTIVAVKQQGKMVWGYLTAAFTGLLLYFVLIPRFSYTGAAIGTIATEWTVVCFGAYFIYRASRVSPKLLILAKVLLASAVMAGVAYVLRNTQWIVASAAAGVVYLVVLYLMRAIPADLITKVLRPAKVQEN